MGRFHVRDIRRKRSATTHCRQNISTRELARVEHVDRVRLFKMHRLRNAAERHDGIRLRLNRGVCNDHMPASAGSFDYELPIGQVNSFWVEHTH